VSARRVRDARVGRPSEICHSAVAALTTAVSRRNPAFPKVLSSRAETGDMDFMLATAAFAYYGGSAVIVNTAWRRVVLSVRGMF